MSKGLSDEIIKSPNTSDNSLATSLNYINARPRVKFNGQCLKQGRITFCHKNIVKIYFYKIYIYMKFVWSFRPDDDFTLENALFGAAKLTKNADKNK